MAYLTSGLEAQKLGLQGPWQAHSRDGHQSCHASRWESATSSQKEHVCQLSSLRTSCPPYTSRKKMDARLFFPNA
eukprot:CAMPEP_0182811658 /NCGR_PEP_ID=MMETSP0006_2-20121128/8389_1 /TAXON_ID=97485 /ORGANISM="Prymnesium parvum, Strain Texoma1" /LENGTH=74 /DNA_ID=CAMNT_0024937633 /DNA_START=576 /DNA_END=800 /DNA_ORIENTATION=+